MYFFCPSFVFTILAIIAKCQILFRPDPSAPSIIIVAGKQKQHHHVNGK